MVAPRTLMGMGTCQELLQLLSAGMWLVIKSDLSGGAVAGC
jgi:hypothetical protein